VACPGLYRDIFIFHFTDKEYKEGRVVVLVASCLGAAFVIERKIEGRSEGMTRKKTRSATE
jgi:hypothetical protein